MTTSAELLALIVEDAPATEAEPLTMPRYRGRGATATTASDARIVRRSREGDDSSDGDEQFRSAHHALMVWHRWRNASAVTVKGSTPKRGAARVDGGKVPQIGGKLTAKLHAHSVEPSVHTACEAGYVTTDGRVRLDAGEVAFVVYHILGEISPRGVAEGKSAQEIADALNAARASTGEHAVTAVHVGLCREGVWRAVGDSLHARNLLPRPEPRRQRKSHQETKMALPPSFDLETWKEIASHCGESESSVKRAAKAGNDPLPVHDYRGRVVARRAELTAWCSRQVRSRAATT
jgi:hypothetical protein